MQFTNDLTKSIKVIRLASAWMSKTKKEVSIWWSLDNLNEEFLLQYAKLEQFFVGEVDGEEAVAAVLQIEQNAQDWQQYSDQPALYVHWLAVSRQFAGTGATGEMIDFAEKMAAQMGVNFLRADTDAQNSKLCAVYEKLGFDLVAKVQEDYRTTALYEKKVKVK